MIRKLAKLSKKSQKNTIKGIEKDLKNIETQLNELVKTDENLNRIFKQATSVPGVGKVTALFLIVFTNEFTTYTTPRQLACYCGVVPFEDTSDKTSDAVLKDELIVVEKDNKSIEIRRVAYWDVEKNKVYEFITNNLEISPDKVADIYKHR